MWLKSTNDIKDFAEREYFKLSLWLSKILTFNVQNWKKSFSIKDDPKKLTNNFEMFAKLFFSFKQSKLFQFY